MKKDTKKSIFFYVMTPLILQWCVSFGVQFLAQSLIEEVYKYTAEITIVIAIIIIPIASYLYKKDTEEFKIVPKHTSGMKEVLMVWIIGICSCILWNSFILCMNMQEYSDSYREVSEIIYEAPLVVQIVGLGMIAPAMEELLYRGILYRRLRAFLSAKVSIIFSAVVFGILHGNFVQFVFATGLGILLAFIYESYQRIDMVIQMHMAINLTSLVMTWVNGFDKILSGEWLVIIALTLLIDIVLFWKMLQKC